MIFKVLDSSNYKHFPVGADVYLTNIGGILIIGTKGNSFMLMRPTFIFEDAKLVVTGFRDIGDGQFIKDGLILVTP
jgi:hypothetical protein